MEPRKAIFDELRKHGYSSKAAYSHLNGSRKPSLEAMVKIEEAIGIPVRAWLDITSYLNNHSRTTTTRTSRAQEAENQRKETA